MREGFDAVLVVGVVQGPGLTLGGVGVAEVFAQGGKPVIVPPLTMGNH